MGIGCQYTVIYRVTYGFGGSLTSTSANIYLGKHLSIQHTLRCECQYWNKESSFSGMLIAGINRLSTLSAPSRVRGGFWAWIITYRATLVGGDDKDREMLEYGQNREFFPQNSSKRGFIHVSSSFCMVNWDSRQRSYWISPIRRSYVGVHQKGGFMCNGQHMGRIKHYFNNLNRTYLIMH